MLTRRSNRENMCQRRFRFFRARRVVRHLGRAIAVTRRRRAGRIALIFDNRRRYKEEN